MAIKTIKNQGFMLEDFAKQLHELALAGKIKPIPYNQQQTSTLRFQRFKLNHNKFTVICEDGEEISKVGWINFAHDVIVKGNEGIGIDFTKARFPFIIAQIRGSAIIDVEDVGIISKNGKQETPELNEETVEEEEEQEEQEEVELVKAEDEVEEKPELSLEKPELPEADTTEETPATPEEIEVIETPIPAKKARVRRTKA